LRQFRLFKLARYSEPMQTLGDVFKAKAGDLAVAFFILFIVLIFASSLMYHAEHEAQPEAFSSIPTSMWWGIVTLTTIGYGDVYPVTVAGKFIAAGVAVLGIAVYAIPTGIMASAFTEELRKKRQKPRKCPHCGKELI
jgi:voltage-gated potassium channel